MKWFKFKMHVIDVLMRRYSARASVIEDQQCTSYVKNSLKSKVVSD